MKILLKIITFLIIVLFLAFIIFIFLLRQSFTYTPQLIKINDYISLQKIKNRNNTTFWMIDSNTDAIPEKNSSFNMMLTYPKEAYKVNEEIRISISLEALELGSSYFDGADHEVYGFIIDGLPTSKPHIYDSGGWGKMECSPYVDNTFSAGAFRFHKPGKHTIQWKGYINRCLECNINFDEPCNKNEKIYVESNVLDIQIK